MNRAVILCLLFCPAFFTFAVLRGAVFALFELKKSKSKVKKELRELSFVQKILLLGYADRCLCCPQTARRLVTVYRVYLTVLLLCAGLWGISALISSVQNLFRTAVLAKVFLLDIPIGLYGILMTRRDKVHGGVAWVWTKKR